MFVHSRSTFENHTRFQTKIGKVYTRFQTKMVQNPQPFGAAHTYMVYIGEYPPLLREVRWFSAKIDVGLKNIGIRVDAALSIT